MFAEPGPPPRGGVFHTKSFDLKLMRLPAPRFSRRPHDASGVHVLHVPRGFPRKVVRNHSHHRTRIRTDDHMEARIDMAPLRSRLGMRAYQIAITPPPATRGLYFSWDLSSRLVADASGMPA